VARRPLDLESSAFPLCHPVLGFSVTWQRVFPQRGSESKSVLSCLKGFVATSFYVKPLNGRQCDIWLLKMQGMV
jgi:hypothetical protein